MKSPAPGKEESPAAIWAGMQLGCLGSKDGQQHPGLFSVLRIMVDIDREQVLSAFTQYSLDFIQNTKVLGCPIQETGTNWSKFSGGHQDSQGWRTCPMRRG